jgi:hypothetical protein
VRTLGRFGGVEAVPLVPLQGSHIVKNFGMSRDMGVDEQIT